MLVTVNYSNKVKETRKALKVSQAQLAKMTGISQQDISDIENNKIKNINTDKIVKINFALGLNIADCLDTKNYNPSEIATAQKILEELFY